MVHKRPFVEEDIFEVSYKQSRHAEPIFPDDAVVFSNASGEGRFSNINTKCAENLANAIYAKHRGIAEDFEANVPDCIAISSLGTCSTREEYSWPEEPLRIPSFAECLNLERHVRTIARLEDIYSILMQYPPRKPVLVGPNHQADIPEYESQVIGHTSNCKDVSETATGRYENELMGTCIIPIPALESSSYDENVGSGRPKCSCEDKDSVRCVMQHILEAREELRKSLGHKIFMELGFYGMGELVAEKWSEQEEQLFRKVVFSNPASLGRNFWDSLASVFPYRTKEDIISYYFNVFMLRKRAEQNRCESMSIDSDNDEWQGTDDSDNNEAEFSKEDEDSVVESPVCIQDFAQHQSQENGLCVFDEDVADETSDNHSLDFASRADAMKVSETCSGKLFSDCGSDLIAQLPQNTLKDARGEQEVQDDSCTSSDTGGALQETRVNANNFNESNDDGSNGFVSEPCDAKIWDAGYPTCQKNKIDFSPTSSMIEEVFGDGS